ncbi:hypothetical protein [Halococcus sediminicola]|uniref:hypothetical protein n=1 Tax=Halococcus sediminicola TaxID=1264579 RepID=UPI00067897AD|nr:hypothetical protein [Halococcus sediminicola]
MTGQFELTPIRRLYVWTGTLVVYGGSFALDGVLSLQAGADSLAEWTTVFSGCLIVVAALYGAVNGDPDEYSTNRFVLALLVVGALLSVGGLVFRYTG